ncbi:hypothetical protein CTA2_7847 [Colletotrichum tanaceti]|uniref:C2H2-type domain-containing protein n=1 Tax=Colletotrichum tanaceti TaxID=1306861 RepID=A0A4U6XDJ1_9PEZI|nr:hypothetical protein CTA2_7847 [Colletotrichum tanaceti]TKW53514.1 hypothetical protein CTA1_4292 [Colletotrichum tanaceti]
MRQSVELDVEALDHQADDGSFESIITEHECDDCLGCFSNVEDLRDHRIREYYYCQPCNRCFQTHNDARQHLNSKTHRVDTIRCPFCTRACNTAAGLIHHLEQGACPDAPLDRVTLYEIIRRRDPNGLISERLQGLSASPMYTATERAYNTAASAYQCYLCHRLFTALQGFNMHLNSPVLKQVLYYCPNQKLPPQLQNPCWRHPPLGTLCVSTRFSTMSRGPSTRYASFLSNGR